MSSSSGDDSNDDKRVVDKRRDSSPRDRRRRRRRHDDDDDDSSTRGSGPRRRRKHNKSKKRKKKHKRKRSADDSSSSSSSSSCSEDSSREAAARRRHRKRRRRKKKERKQKKSTTKSVDDIPDGTFGKYGIIKQSDFYQKERSFTIWLEEVKGIGAFNGPKWELQNYFKDYMEDFNTATLPHIKYYDYEKWEMEEYEKNKRSGSASNAAGSTVQQDEALHRVELQAQARKKQREELDLVKSMMNRDKIEEMKRKKQLQAELAHAYKTGDQETYRRIKNRLEPEDR